MARKALRHTLLRQGGVAGKRLPYCALSHNDTYLKSLPKTGCYLIVDLQKELAQRGCLKTQQDQEEFWSMVGQNRKTALLETRLREIRGMMIGERSAPDLRSVRFTQKDTLRPAPTIQITVDRESHQEQAVLSEGEAGQHFQGKHPQERADIEQMFPKVPVPKFVTLQTGFLEQFKPRSLSQLNLCEPPQKTMTTEQSVQRLRLMHSRSLTNMATTQRLLDGNRISLHWEEENSIRSLMQYVFPADDSRVKQSIITPEVITTEAELVVQKPPDPLTLEEVSQQPAVVVIERLCKTWTNYVGNSNMVEGPPALATTTMTTTTTTTNIAAEKKVRVTLL
ncbi:hypothetical protein SKAU_G00163550 [Synaphobranchus kaupii]|uniref:Uncharacterized protein n=1 Tax=Synaphobranchus kaupii TaxID=118154 RepID=A0A9Q1FIZ7_SYNKA|nr:hypothetical protein SKAU_G00163550 [Synaphobranchus kaupii]